MASGSREGNENGAFWEGGKARRHKAGEDFAESAVRVVLIIVNEGI